MKFHRKGAELYVPDQREVASALDRTTHMAVGAHQDDLEIMAAHGILQCFGQREKWFFGVTVTDGAGSPRDGIYGRFSDEEMRKIRKVEQKKAAALGEYGLLALLDYPSAAVKDAGRGEVVKDIRELVLRARPEVVYTHNLADKHSTHVAVSLRVIEALRSLPPEARPVSLYGCEVWRNLDWLVDSEKIHFDVSGHENITNALVSVFDSQICGGKRYDLATAGRWRSNATYFESHDTDQATGLTFAMDLSPLVADSSLDVEMYVTDHIRRFLEDVGSRIRKFAPSKW